jgi:hypothetical protein
MHTGFFVFDARCKAVTQSNAAVPSTYALVGLVDLEAVALVGPLLGKLAVVRINRRQKEEVRVWQRQTPAGVAPPVVNMRCNSRKRQRRTDILRHGLLLPCLALLQVLLA